MSIDTAKFLMLPMATFNVVLFDFFGYPHLDDDHSILHCPPWIVAITSLILEVAASIMNRLLLPHGHPSNLLDL